MKYIIRLPKADESIIPLQINDNSTGIISFKKNESLKLDRGLTPDSGWIEFAITCLSAVPLSVLANVIYDHIFNEKPKLIEEYETEINIEKPDGTIIHIRKKQTVNNS